MAIRYRSHAMKIEDYGIIGDTHTVALVGRNGSIDWACLPHFDSPACFAALLGKEEHGFWRIAPTGDVVSTRRRYREGTLVLETEFETRGGRVRLIDFMPPRQESPRLIRIVEGITGEVDLRMQLAIRFDYGSTVPWMRKVNEHHVAIAGPNALSVWAETPTRGEGMTTVSDFSIRAGERKSFAVHWHPSHEEPQPLDDAQTALKHTEQWWRDWIAPADCDGEWREPIERSLITLKALTFAPTGGIVAAPTTSLPERIGSVRNWDYRFCWLRDATFTLYSMLRAGFKDEACAWRDWLLRAVAGDPSKLQIMYGIHGERWLREMELPWLPGYESSVPVRIGNAASDQFQLDVYGELIDAMHQARCAGQEPGGHAWEIQCALMEFLETAWHHPDEGIWEVRGPRRHFTHSKVMAWLAFSRAVSDVEHFGLEGPVDRWRAHRDHLHAEVCARGFNRERQSFVQEYDSDRLDASLLMVPLVGFLPISDARVQGTIKAIETELFRDGFVQRYRTEKSVDGLPPGEAAFLPCTFWLVDNYVLSGRKAEARELFEKLLAVRNDLGLLAEEYDTQQQRLVGNFPQAFSHVGLVNTAQNLASTAGPAHQRCRHRAKPAQQCAR